MKKLVALSILMLGLTGCIRLENAPDYDAAWTDHGNVANTKVVKIEGHRYIILCGPNSCAIVHAESCDCKK